MKAVSTAFTSAALPYSPLNEEKTAPPQGAAGLQKPAPAALTRMRGPTEAARRIDSQNEGTARAGVSAKRAWISMKANHQKAKGAGVDATKKSFWSKVLGATVGALALGAVISLAVGTGGAALVGAAVIAGVVFAISAADAGCAYMNYKNSKAHAAGEPLPYNLPMGSSSVGNLMHRALSAVGASPARAKLLATIGDGVLRIGIGAAVGACTMGASVAVNSFEHIAPMVGAASTILQTAVDLKHNRSTSKVYAESMDEIDKSAEKINTLLSEVEVTSPEDRATLAAAQKKVRDDAAKTKELVPSMIETTALAVPVLVVTGTALAQSLCPGIDLSAIGSSSGPTAYAKHGGGSLGGFSPQQAKNPAAIS